MGGICRSPSSPQGRLKLRPLKTLAFLANGKNRAMPIRKSFYGVGRRLQKKNKANLSSRLMRSLAAVNCDLARSATPPEMREQHQRDHPKPLDAERAQGRGAVEFAEINLQRRISDVLERQLREQDADFVREEGHRNQQAGEQFDEPVFGANQREDRFQRNRTGADQEIDRAHEEKAAEHADGE